MVINLKDSRFKAMLFPLFAVLVIFIMSSTSSRAEEPIKIGVIHAHTGVHTSVGKAATNGLLVSFEQIGYEVAGRKVEVIVEDAEGKSDVALTKARKLVEKNKVNILVGPVDTASAYALRSYVETNKLPMIITIAFARDLTQAKKSPYIFRVNATGDQVSRPFGRYAYEKLGLRKAVVMASDVAAGHEVADGFMETFKQAGGQVVKEIYPPLDTADYGPFIATIDVGKADTVWTWFAGAAAVRFVNQYNEYGLKTRIRLIGHGAVNDTTVLGTLGEGAIGIVSALNYTPSLKNPENAKFVKAYRQKFGEEVIEWAVMGFTAGKVIVEAAKAIEGRVEETSRFLEALRKVNFDDPRGPFKFDTDQNPIQNVYILKTIKKDGKVVNDVIDTIPDVSQYWPR